MTQNVSVSVDSPYSPEAASLLEELHRELLARYPQHCIHGVKLDELEAEKGAFVIARLAGRPVGCGALRRLEEGVGEVKRMFVRPEARRRGVARVVLAKLEETARALGFRTLRLETGARQPEAIALYESHDYRPIPRFGEYADDPFSVCYEKAL
jgi:GNAT superfamily N-acetyltransferase